MQRAWLVCSKRKIAFKREAHLHDLSKGACATIDKVLPVYFEPRFIADKTMRRRNEDERARQAGRHAGRGVKLMTFDEFEYDYGD